MERLSLGRDSAVQIAEHHYMVTSTRRRGTAGNPYGRSLMDMLIVDRFDLADGAFPLTARATRGVQSTTDITPVAPR